MFLLIACTHLAADRFTVSERQVLMNCRQVECVDDGQHFLDYPTHVAILGLLKLGQKIDQLLDEAKRARYVLACIVEGNGFRIGVEPREKQSVGKHLSEGIGKFVQCQLMEDLITEN